MNELIPVTILIADRTYRLKIHPKDEEMLRKTVKTINEKVIEYKTQFAGKDMQDYVSMVLVVCHRAEYNYFTANGKG
jgi:cell division protein ZapA